MAKSTTGSGSKTGSGSERAPVSRPDGIDLARREITNQSAREAGALGFAHPHLVACTLPARKIKGEIYERSVPWCTMTINGNGFGVPYGVTARLFLAWVQTEAVTTQSPIVELGRTLSEAAENIMGKSGLDHRALRRFKKQLLSCSMANWILDVDMGVDPAAPSEESWRRVREIRKFSLGSRVKFAFDERSPRQVELWDPKVELSSDFYEALNERSVPYDWRALRALARSPLGLDLYMWASAIAPNLSAPRHYPMQWFLEQWGTSSGDGSDLKGQGLPDAVVNARMKDRRKQFRRRFGNQLKRVLRLYPGLDAQMREGGLLLKPSRPHVARLPGR